MRIIIIPSDVTTTDHEQPAPAEHSTHRHSLADTGTPAADKPEGPAAASRGWRTIDAPSRLEAAEIGSRFLYVAEQGTVLRRSGTRIILTKRDVELMQVPIVRLQGVLLYGNIQVSTQCLRTLLAENVWVSFFSSWCQV